MTHLKLLNVPCWHPSGTSTCFTIFVLSCFVFSLSCFEKSGTWSYTIFIFRHDMHTGRWLTKLSAVWDPKREDCFVVGSMSNPRRVQVFHENGHLQHTFIDQENFKTVLSVTAFHPTRKALLGGNASGRLHIFSDWDEPKMYMVKTPLVAVSRIGKTSEEMVLA